MKITPTRSELNAAIGALACAAADDRKAGEGAEADALDIAANFLRHLRDELPGEAPNRFYPPQCQHVRTEQLDAAERLTFTTIGGRDDGYAKGPDVMDVCLLCAGWLMAKIGDPFVVGS